METLKPEGTTLKKTTKNKTKHWKKMKHNNEPYTVLNNETHWKKKQENIMKNNDKWHI
jgi:hypothetical protein